MNTGVWLLIPVPRRNYPRRIFLSHGLPN